MTVQRELLTTSAFFEMDAGTFDGEQNASSNARDTCANDRDLKRRKSHSLHMEILGTVLEPHFQFWRLVYRMLPELKRSI